MYILVKSRGITRLWAEHTASSRSMIESLTLKREITVFCPIFQHLRRSGLRVLKVLVSGLGLSLAQRLKLFPMVDLKILG